MVINLVLLRKMLIFLLMNRWSSIFRFDGGDRVEYATALMD